MSMAQSREGAIVPALASLPPFPSSVSSGLGPSFPISPRLLVRGTASSGMTTAITTSSTALVPSPPAPPTQKVTVGGNKGEQRQDDTAEACVGSMEVAHQQGDGATNRNHSGISKGAATATAAPSSELSPRAMNLEQRLKKIAAERAVLQGDLVAAWPLRRVDPLETARIKGAAAVAVANQYSSISPTTANRGGGLTNTPRMGNGLNPSTSNTSLQKMHNSPRQSATVAGLPVVPFPPLTNVGHGEARDGAGPARSALKAPLAIEIDGFIRKELRHLARTEANQPTKLQTLAVYREAFGVLLSRFPEYSDVLSRVKKEYDSTIDVLLESQHTLLKLQVENRSLKETSKEELFEVEAKHREEMAQLRDELKKTQTALENQKNRIHNAEREVILSKDMTREKDKELDELTERVRTLSHTLTEQASITGKYVQRVGRLRADNDRLLDLCTSLQRGLAAQQNTHFDSSPDDEGVSIRPASNKGGSSPASAAFASPNEATRSVTPSSQGFLGSVNITTYNGGLLSAPSSSSAVLLSNNLSGSGVNASTKRKSVAVSGGGGPPRARSVVVLDDGTNLDLGEVRQQLLELRTTRYNEKIAYAESNGIAMASGSTYGGRPDITFGEDEDLREQCLSLEAEVKSLQKKLADANADLKSMSQRLEGMQRAMDDETLTPRPEWLEVQRRVPDFSLNHLSSTNDVVNDLVSFMSDKVREDLLENERKAVGRTVVQWFGENNMCESDLLHSGKHFIPKGTGPHVPIYLRTRDRIKDKRMRKGDVEVLLKRFWFARRLMLKHFDESGVGKGGSAGARFGFLSSIKNKMRHARSGGTLDDGGGESGDEDGKEAVPTTGLVDDNTITPEGRADEGRDTQLGERRRSVPGRAREPSRSDSLSSATAVQKLRDEHFASSEAFGGIAGVAGIKAFIVETLASSPFGALPPLDEFFLAWLVFETGGTKLAVELAYNIIGVCERYQSDPDCGLFLRIIGNEVCEQTIYDQMSMVEELFETLRKLDTQRHGYVSRIAVHRTLARLFPAKRRQDMHRLRFALITFCRGADVVDYRALFGEDHDGNQTNFIELLRTQHFAEIASHVVDVEESLREIIDKTTGRINVEAARQVLLNNDPKLPPAKVDEILCCGCAMSIGELAAKGNLFTIPAEGFLRRIRTGVLLKRYSSKNEGRSDDDDDDDKEKESSTYDEDPQRTNLGIKKSSATNFSTKTGNGGGNLSIGASAFSRPRSVAISTSTEKEADGTSVGGGSFAFPRHNSGVGLAGDRGGAVRKQSVTSVIRVNSTSSLLSATTPEHQRHPSSTAGPSNVSTTPGKGLSSHTIVVSSSSPSKLSSPNIALSSPLPSSSLITTVVVPTTVPTTADGNGNAVKPRRTRRTRRRGSDYQEDVARQVKAIAEEEMKAKKDAEERKAALATLGSARGLTKARAGDDVSSREDGERSDVESRGYIPSPPPPPAPLGALNPLGTLNLTASTSPNANESGRDRAKVVTAALSSSPPPPHLLSEEAIRSQSATLGPSSPPSSFREKAQNSPRTQNPSYHVSGAGGGGGLTSDTKHSTSKKRGAKN